MNELIEKEKSKIEDMIYEIRGKQVMLDSDLAKLYHCANGTKSINLAVKRHINRFPERFMFQLTEEESRIIWFQIETKNGKVETRGGKFDQPFVFTEQGVSMLSAVLRTDVAEEVSIRIMDAFVAMKKYISNNLLEQRYINNLVLEDHEKIKLLEESFNIMDEKNNHLFFEGQIYDAYSLLLDIFNKSEKEIIIIDNYIDKNLLDILSKTKKVVKVITNKYNNDDYNKYKKQYNNVKLTINNNFHDRFIIIDKKILYHCGASFKDLGNKCFEISKIEEEEILFKILKMLTHS